MMKKTKSFLGVAGCILAAGSLYAADYIEPFEGGTTAWQGGTLTPTTYTYSPSPNVGQPLPDAGHTKVLVVEGDASYEPPLNAFSGSPLVDMMMQAALPDEELEAPEGDARIAVAVDQTGKFNVYCGNKSGEGAGWHSLSTKTYTDGTWVRVSLLFDYHNGLCQVRIDGQPMMTEYGYLNVAKEGTTGAWYPLVSSAQAVGGLKVVGCTAIDDVVIAANATGYAITSGAKTNGVSCAWLDQYGLAWDTTKTYDSSNMTVADKYKYCFSPFDGQAAAVFAVKSISTTTEKVTLALPATVETAGRKVVVDYGTDKNFGEGTYSTTDEVTGEPTVQIKVPAPGSVTYYRLRATDK